MSNKKLRTLDQFQSLRKNIGFHFTSQCNIESILETGLLPKIGDNSSGGLGQEAIEKTFFSYGLEGVSQLYNRLLNASVTLSLYRLQHSETHTPFIPDSSQGKQPKEKLTILEGFELVRQYMEDNVYFVFDLPQTQYEHEVSQADIEEINSAIPTIKIPGTENTICERIKELDEEISALMKSDDPLKKEKLKAKSEERNALSIQIRRETLKMLDQKRGIMINSDEDPIIEQHDYHEENLYWYDQLAKPHNAHTRIVEDESGLHGVKITPDIVRLYSRDGETHSTGLDFIRDLYDRATPEDRVNLTQDCPLLEQFIEYIDLVEKYKEDGLLSVKPETTVVIKGKTRIIPEREVMDLSDISKYEGLREYESRLQAYYRDNKFVKKTASLGEESIDVQKNTQYIIQTEQGVTSQEKGIDENSQSL